MEKSLYSREREIFVLICPPYLFFEFGLFLVRAANLDAFQFHKHKKTIIVTQFEWISLSDVCQRESERFDA